VSPLFDPQSPLFDHLVFLGALVRNPRSVGAIVPSSERVAADMVTSVQPASRVVELGPGTGVITKAVLARLGPSGALLAVETNHVFVERLQRSWPKADVVCASAEALPDLTASRGWEGVDHIVSGLPFATLPRPVTLHILDAIRDVLKVGGTFTTFQYAHAYRLPPAVRFRRELSDRLGSPPRSHLVLWNVPPAHILTWVRR